MNDFAAKTVHFQLKQTCPEKIQTGGIVDMEFPGVLKKNSCGFPKGLGF